MRFVFLLLALVFLKVVFLERVYHCLPLAELKRRARDRQPGAAGIYKVAAFGRSLDLLLLLFGASSGVVLVIWSARYAWWAAVVALGVMAWLLLWAPSSRVGGWSWRLVGFSAPYVFKILNWLNPVLSPLASLLPKTAGLNAHTGAYQTEDLLAILENQARQADNRINREDLKIAAGALTFGAKKVAQVMTPRRKIKFVSEDEVVGPTLMDELHKSGHIHFPIVKGSAKAAKPSVIGTLYLRDAVQISHEDKGKVKDLMKKGTYFINESCTLSQALDAILKKQHHLLVVINNFEEMTGVITLEDILEQIVGALATDEFDNYDDLRAVANFEAAKEKAAHAHEVEASAEAVPEPAIVNAKE